MEGAHSILSGRGEVKASLKGLVEAIGNCSRCPFIDKPFLLYGVYENWLPRKVKVLLVAESPPPGPKADFFYNLALPDRLRRNIRTILGLPIGEKEVPAWLKNAGAFLTCAVKCRPYQGRATYRDEKAIRLMAIRCAPILALEVKALRPGKVILLGRIAEAAASVIGLEPYARLPHPNFMVRFRRDLMPEARATILSALFDPG
ncbi:MAG TPA: hypothetical protein ENF78_06225 [Candidatus Bathyarchaeota archaeon]|nr:hypothetical protein [Candidatus Bathyarchaeota archaeon]